MTRGAGSGPGEEWARHRVEPAEAGRTVEQVLRETLGVSGRRIQRLTRSRGVRLNGRAAFLGKKVRAGDLVSCRVSDAGSGTLQGGSIPLEVLHEDDELLIVNKPAGMLVHPVRKEPDTLAHGVADHLRARGIAAAVHAVHRLDRDTSGAVLFAKSAVLHHRLAQQLTGDERAGFEREYLALVQGSIVEERGRIDASIGRDPARRGRRAVVPNGAAAVTHFEVAERFWDATLLRVRLVTGRTHQIRVHLAHIGHPVIGDRMYGGRTGEIGRQALHAERLSCVNPASGEPVTVSAPLPEDFRRALDRLRSAPPDG